MTNRFKGLELHSISSNLSALYQFFFYQMKIEPYADDTTFMAESEEELKILLMKVKEESEKVGLNVNIQKTKIMVSGPITSRQTNEEPMEKVTDFIFFRLQNHCRWLQPWN